jgi:hypothetical protein
LHRHWLRYFYHLGLSADDRFEFDLVEHGLQLTSLIEAKPWSEVAFRRVNTRLAIDTERGPLGDLPTELVKPSDGCFALNINSSTIKDCETNSSRGPLDDQVLDCVQSKLAEQHFVIQWDTDHDEFKMANRQIKLCATRLLKSKTCPSQPSDILTENGIRVSAHEAMRKLRSQFRCPPKELGEKNQEKWLQTEECLSRRNTAGQRNCDAKT